MYIFCVLILLPVAVDHWLLWTFELQEYELCIVKVHGTHRSTVWHCEGGSVWYFGIWTLAVSVVWYALLVKCDISSLHISQNICLRDTQIIFSGRTPDAHCYTTTAKYILPISKTCYSSVYCCGCTKALNLMDLGLVGQCSKHICIYSPE